MSSGEQKMGGEKVEMINDRLSAVFEALRRGDNLLSEAEEQRDMAKENGSREIESLRASLIAQVKVVSKNVEKSKLEVAQMTKTKSDLLAEMASLEEKLEMEDEAGETVEGRIGEVRDQLEGIGSENVELAAKELRLEQRLKKLSNEATQVEKQLATAEEETEHLSGKLVDARARFKKSESNYQFYKKRNETEILRLRDEIRECRHSDEHLEKRMRAEFTAQMKKIVQERDVIMKNENEEMSSNLQVSYDEKLEEAAGQLRDLREYLQQLEEEVGAMAAQYEKLEEKNDDLYEENSQMEKEITQLDIEITELRATPAPTVQRLEREIADYRDSIEQKEQEILDLHDVKVKMNMELSIYKRLLEDEETRIGMREQRRKVQSSPSPTRNAGIEIPPGL